jgi:N-acetylglutamate synthase-like GNAT family acetyltransferase
MISKSEPIDLDEIHTIINDAASAYRGIIPPDRWHEPYMASTELKEQVDSGIEFWVYKEEGEILGVMGIQHKGPVTLIRHAYVRTKVRQKGIDGKLLKHLCALTANPILIGTWADARWAVEFYQKHGFRLLSELEKNALLRKYWTIPVRQIETSVVLASPDWEGDKASLVQR